MPHYLDMPATNTATKYYAVVTFGRPSQPLPVFLKTKDRAVKLAGDALGTGTCTSVQVYECDTVALAKSADISGLRDGERRVWAAS